MRAWTMPLMLAIAGSWLVVSTMGCKPKEETASVEPIPEPKRAVPIYDSETQEQTRKGISPIAIAIIIVCLILMVYIVFFAK